MYSDGPHVPIEISSIHRGSDDPNVNQHRGPFLQLTKMKIQICFYRVPGRVWRNRRLAFIKEYSRCFFEHLYERVKPNIDSFWAILDLTANGMCLLERLFVGSYIIWTSVCMLEFYRKWNPQISFDNTRKLVLNIVDLFGNKWKHNLNLIFG